MSDAYSDWKQWSAADFGRHSAQDDRYFGWHGRRALGRDVANLRVLEVGFGNGSFLGWARSRGCQVVGVETNPALVQTAREAGYDVHAALADVPTQPPFDLAAAFDVAEHVGAEHLPAFVDGLFARLGPEGRVLLRFPNGESPFGLWMQNGDLTHVHALGVSRMRQLCGQLGLELLHQGEPLPWRAQRASRWPGLWAAAVMRRAFEWSVRKMYRMPRGMDLQPNQVVVLGRRARAADTASPSAPST